MDTLLDADTLTVLFILLYYLFKVYKLLIFIFFYRASPHSTFILAD